MPRSCSRDPGRLARRRARRACERPRRRGLPRARPVRGVLPLPRPRTAPFVDELAEVVTRPGAARARAARRSARTRSRELDVFKARIPNLFGNYLRLDRLDREAGARGDHRAARAHGPSSTRTTAVEIEPALVEAVLDQRSRRPHRRSAAARSGGVERPTTDGSRRRTCSSCCERLWEAEREQGRPSCGSRRSSELGGARADRRASISSARSPRSTPERARRRGAHVPPPRHAVGHEDRARVADLAEYAGVPGGRASRRCSPTLAPRPHRAPACDGVRYEIFHDVLADAVLAWRTQHEAERRLEQQRAARTPGSGGSRSRSPCASWRWLP